MRTREWEVEVRKSHRGITESIDKTVKISCVHSGWRGFTIVFVVVTEGQRMVSPKSTECDHKFRKVFFTGLIKSRSEKKRGEIVIRGS